MEKLQVLLACTALLVILTSPTLATEGIFTSSPVSVDDCEIINPLRGYYNERRISVQGSAGYARLVWQALEPRQDVYDFTAIDTLLEQNRRLGRKAGLRIRALTGKGQSVLD